MESVSMCLQGILTVNKVVTIVARVKLGYLGERLVILNLIHHIDPTDVDSTENDTEIYSKQ